MGDGAPSCWNMLEGYHFGLTVMEKIRLVKFLLNFLAIVRLLRDINMISILCCLVNSIFRVPNRINYKKFLKTKNNRISKYN